MDSTLVQVLVAVAVAALVALVGFAARWLAARTKSEALLSVITETKETMLSVVAFVDAEMKPALAAAHADGVVTAEEGAQLKARATALFLQALGERGLARLKRTLGLSAQPGVVPLPSGGVSPIPSGVDVFVSGLVERSLTAQKAISAQVDAARQLAAGTANPQMPPGLRR